MTAPTTIPVKIKLLTEGATVPKNALFGDAGFDVTSTIDHILKPGETLLVPTGISIEIPTNTVAYVCSRSGLAAKNSVAVLNAPGVIDSGYRGEVKVILHNFGTGAFTVLRGDRIAQLVIQEYLAPVFEIVDEVSVSERGAGGGGHTGIR